METRCILQVEDEESDVFLLHRAFRRAGIQNPVHVARDGQEAIEYLSGLGKYADRKLHPLPCLVLLDIKLPKRTGMEVLQWIREQPQFKSLPVVVLSSSAEPQDVRQAGELGANSYVQKPTSLEKTQELTEFFKGWWLGFHRFPPVYEAHDGLNQHVPKAA